MDRLIRFYISGFKIYSGELGKGILLNSMRGKVIFLSIVYALMVLLCLLKPADEYSISERRKLAQKPDFSWEAVASGKYMKQTEEYVTDQFIFRDEFRSLKSMFSLGIMQKKDVNEIYLVNGYLSQMEYPMDDASIERAVDIFREIYNEYLNGTEVTPYLSIIPDKNYYLIGRAHSVKDVKRDEADSGKEQLLLEENISVESNSEYLVMDYMDFLDKAYSQADFLMEIRIEDSLKLEDFYQTDTHWKQEKIIDTAALLADAMKTEISGEYTIETVEAPFYGVYYGQAALPVEADEIKYCTNDILEKCKVYDYENNTAIPLYDLNRTTGRDPYEMFLGGNISLAVIENPNVFTTKELVVFGDSFSRSMVPLLAEGYKKTTLVDIRYLPSAYVGQYVTFTDQDVLFLYSTSVLNNSITLK